MTLKDTVTISVGFLCLAVLINNCSAQNQYYYPPEPQCSGFCITESQCPKDKLSQSESCPKSRSEGVACCYDVPKSETRCRMLGGECMTSCRSNMRRPKATDCSSSEFCCILV